MALELQHLENLRKASAASVGGVPQNTFALQRDYQLAKQNQELNFDAQEAAFEHEQDAQELALELQYIQNLKNAQAAALSGTTTTNGAATTTAAANPVTLGHQIALEQAQQEYHFDSKELALEREREAQELSLELQYLDSLRAATAARTNGANAYTVQMEHELQKAQQEFQFDQQELALELEKEQAERSLDAKYLTSFASFYNQGGHRGYPSMQELQLQQQARELEL